MIGTCVRCSVQDTSPPSLCRQEDVVVVVGSDGVFDVLSDAEAGHGRRFSQAVDFQRRCR